MNKCRAGFATDEQPLNVANNSKGSDLSTLYAYRSYGIGRSIGGY